MHYVEGRLPDHFIRIHRSCIVNGRYIARIEQSGKENYRIRLRNGKEQQANMSDYKKTERAIFMISYIIDNFNYKQAQIPHKNGVFCTGLPNDFR